MSGGSDPQAVRKMSREERGVMARREELHQLAGLNNRLAFLVDKVMRGELEKRRLTRYLETVNETVRLGTGEMEEIYKQQVEELKRKKEDEENKVAEMIERAVEINAENDRLKGREKEVEEENVKHLQEREQLEKERHRLKTLIGEREAKLPAEERRAQQAFSAIPRLEEKLKSIEEKFSEVGKEKEEAEKMLEERKSRKVGEDEVDGWKRRVVNLVTEVEEGGKVLGPLASKLVQDFHTGLEIQELHNEVFSGQTLAAAPVMSDEVKKGERELDEEEEVLKRVRLLLVEVRQKEEEGARLRRKLREMELEMMAGEEEQTRRLVEREEKKEVVLARLDQLTKDRKQLLEMKAGLDLEIGMFRCLVVSEEERLGLMPGPNEKREETEEVERAPIQVPIQVEQEEQTKIHKEKKEETTVQTEEKLSWIKMNQVPINVETTMQTEEKLSGILKKEKKFSLMDQEREGLTELSLEKQH